MIFFELHNLNITKCLIIKIKFWVRNLSFILTKNNIMTSQATNLSQYFQRFRKNVIGINEEFYTPNGKKKMIYADWTASGRLYVPIEHSLLRELWTLCW